jgi:hypothetical protein
MKFLLEYVGACYSLYSELHIDIFSTQLAYKASRSGSCLQVRVERNETVVPDKRLAQLQRKKENKNVLKETKT